MWMLFFNVMLVFLAFYLAKREFEEQEYGHAIMWTMFFTLDVLNTLDSMAKVYVQYF